MICPICKAEITVRDRTPDSSRRGLSEHLETAPHPLGILADYAARYLTGT